MEENTICGKMLEINRSDEFGVYYGRIECPKCHQEVSIQAMGTDQKCRCGIEWDFDVQAVGFKK
jgi:hypothetical protein